MSLSTALYAPAHDVARTGALDSIRALLARGENESTNNASTGAPAETPLAWAARSGDYTTVARLITAGVDLNAGLPLHAAALAVRHAIKTTRRLLEAGSDPRSLDADGRSAADVALAVGNQRLADILIAAGCPTACEDETEAELSRWQERSESAAFLNLVHRFGELCQRTPRLFRDRLRGFRGEGVYRLDFDLNLVAEYLGVEPSDRRVRPEDREPLGNAWIDQLAEEVRERGFLLVRNVHLALDAPYSLLLCPTNDPYSVIYAHDLDGHGATRVNGRPRLLDARGIVAELRELAESHPFELLECGRDALGARFTQPLSACPGGAPTAACTLGDLCSNLLDGDALEGLEGARARLADELNQSGEFFLWWS